MRRLREEFPTSERRVCELMEIPRMSYRHQSRRNDSVLRDRLLALAREKPRTAIAACMYCSNVTRRMSVSITSVCGGCIASWG